MTRTETTTHVMIAEDDDDDYIFFSVAIEETSFSVLLTRAVNGQALLQMLEKNLPDILFLDLLLPITDGKECLRTIRANRKFDNIPVIIYSSLSDLTSVDYCFREGSNLYVIKPSSPVELRDVLERILTINWSNTLYFPQRSRFVINSQLRNH